MSEKTVWVKKESALNEELVNSEMLVFYENKPGGGKWGEFLKIKSTSLPNKEQL